ncbi:hypothetical protein OSTOST_05440 [Ostertagia ostertagi]
MPTTRSQSLSAAATGSASGSASPPSLPGAAAPYQENVLSEVGANAPHRELDPSRSGATTPTAFLDASLSRLATSHQHHRRLPLALQDLDSATTVGTGITWRISAVHLSTSGRKTETGSFSTTTSEDDKTKALQLADSCIIRKNGCLYKVCQRGGHKYEALFLPSKLREPVCIAFHDSPAAGGHFNWKKTLGKIARKFFWPSIKEDVYQFVRSCDDCQRKRSHPANREQLLPIHANAVFHKVYLDLSGPYHTSSSSNKYIMCLIDHFSKYVIASPLPDCTAPTVARSLMNDCILKFGAMTELIIGLISIMDSFVAIDQPSALVPPDPAQGNDHDMVLNQSESPPAAEEAALSSLMSDMTASVDDEEPMDSDVVLPAETMADLLISADPVQPSVLPMSTDVASHSQFVEPKSELSLDSTLQLSDASGAVAPSRESIGAVAPQHELPGASAPPPDDDQPSTSKFKSGGFESFSYASVVARQRAAAAAESAAAGPSRPLPAAPERRVRRRPTGFLTIAPRGQLPDFTPEDHSHHLIGSHPWAQFVSLRTEPFPRIRTSLRPLCRSSCMVTSLQAAWAHRSAVKTVSHFATTRDDITRVDVCVKLGDLPAGTDPLYELISKRQLFGRFDNDSRAAVILDAVYGSRRVRVGPVGPHLENVSASAVSLTSSRLARESMSG